MGVSHAGGGGDPHLISIYLILHIRCQYSGEHCKVKDHIYYYPDQVNDAQYKSRSNFTVGISRLFAGVGINQRQYAEDDPEEKDPDNSEYHSHGSLVFKLLRITALIVWLLIRLLVRLLLIGLGLLIRLLLIRLLLIRLRKGLCLEGSSRRDFILSRSTPRGSTM